MALGCILLLLIGCKGKTTTTATPTGNSTKSTTSTGGTTTSGGTSSTVSGAVTLFAGTTGSSGSSDGAATAATFDRPMDVATDGTDLYVVNYGNYSIRKIVVATGAVTTIAGTSTALDTNGKASTLKFPNSITCDGTNLYFTDGGNSIFKLKLSTGVVENLAGDGSDGLVDGTGTTAKFREPEGMDTDGTYVYVADSRNRVIRKIVIATRVVTTLAGGGTAGTADAVGTAAQFTSPTGVTLVGGDLYVADMGTNTIRKINIATKAVTTFVGSGTNANTDGTGTAAAFRAPVRITNDGTNLYVVDSDYTIRKIVIATGAVTTFAGVSSQSGSVDEVGTAATFNAPLGITRLGDNLYVADKANHTIRKIVK